MSNTLEFGAKLPSSGSQFFQVKQKGDRIQFRIAQTPTYTGKHFLEQEGGWDITLCPRINEQETCDKCELYFGAQAEIKKLLGGRKKEDLTPEEQKEVKGLEGEARKWNAAVQFHFPVLNRDTEQFVVLQTTMGVRNKINEFHENGTNVFEKDFVLRNTGLTGRDLYSLTIVDSADTKKLSDKEKEELAKAKAYDLTAMGGSGTPDEEME